jgi:transcriptional regulator with XRE-family HTH domain
MAKKKERKKAVAKPVQQVGVLGNPYDVNDRVKRSIIALCQQGKTDPEIAQELGIHPRTLANWKADDPNLLQAMSNAKAIADELVEMALFKKATGYSYRAKKFFQHEGCILCEEYEEHVPPDTRAAEIWLRNRQPDRWRDKQEIEFSGGIKLEKLTDEEIDKKIKELEAKDE